MSLIYDDINHESQLHFNRHKCLSYVAGEHIKSKQSEKLNGTWASGVAIWKFMLFCGQSLCGRHNDGWFDAKRLDTRIHEPLDSIAVINKR